MRMQEGGNVMTRTGLAAVGVLVLGGSLAVMLCLGADSPSPRKVELYDGNTVPSDRRQLALKMSDVVKEVNVKPGDVVKAGDVLLVLDDREEQLNLQIIRLEAESDVAVRAAETTRDYKKVELARVQDMYRKQVATQQELDKARLDAELAELEIGKAQVEHGQRQIQARRQETVLDRMRIVCPPDIDRAVVQEVSIRRGELLEVGTGKSAITIVKNDPLWVQVWLPIPVALGLKRQEERTGQKPRLKVIYPDTGESREATIIYYDPVADAASGTQRIRLEMANPENRPSGLPVKVEVPAAGGN